MKLSQNMAKLGTETAFAALAKAQVLEAKGANLIHLEIGEPGFNTPTNICDMVTKAIGEGHTYYSASQGITILRSEIAKHIGGTRGVSIDPECVIVTPGGKPIMFYSILALLEEGDEAIYPNPGFPIYESMINFTGARPVPIALREELDFRLDVNELKSKITPRTKLIIINSPHNPTGAILEEDDIRYIAGLAQKHDITVLSDEVYDRIVYEKAPLSILSIPGMLDRTILLNSFSKTYAMGGWRLGYGVVPRELVDPIVRLIVNSVSCTPTFIQYAGIEALTGSQESVHRMVGEFRKRRDLIVEGLNEIPGISCLLPKGAFYAFPNITRLGMDCKRLADYLLNKGGVVVLAGTDFGKYGQGHIRLSYGTTLENIKESLKRINTAVAKLKL